MKNLIISIIYFLPFIVFSQAPTEVKAYFNKSEEIIKSGSEKEVKHEFQIIIPAQPDLKDSYIEYSLEETIISPKDSDIYLNNNKKIKLTGNKEVAIEKFDMRFKRDSLNDQIILLKLKAFKDDGSAMKLKDSAITHKILIKPYSASLSDSKKNDYQFWIYTGTNLDLLDGVKPKDLYFKADYLVRINNTRFWFDAVIGKNRFISGDETFENIPYSSVIPNPFPQDSINLVRGLYDSAQTTTTERIFTSLNILYHMSGISSEKSKFYFHLGAYLDRQSITSEYNNTITASDTIKISSDSIPRVMQGLARKIVYDQLNYNFGLGVTHILTTEKLEIKTSISFGENYISKPRRITTRGVNRITIIENEWKTFGQFKFDATVLDPGISLGFEAYIRDSFNPLINVYLTKVIDLEKIASLFSPVSSLD